MIDWTDIIHREHRRLEEPAACCLCDRLAETGHVADYGWACLPCCEARPEYAVATISVGGETTAWIGSRYIGTIPLPYWTAGVDDEIKALLERLTGMSEPKKCEDCGKPATQHATWTRQHGPRWLCNECKQGY